MSCFTAKISIVVHDQDGKRVDGNDMEFPVPRGFSESSVGWAIGEALRAGERAFSVEVPEPSKEPYAEKGWQCP